MPNQLPQFPPYLILLPCRLHRVVDADTIDVIAISGLRWRIRLATVDCPERFSIEGKAATAFVKGVLDDAADELTGMILLPENIRERVLAGTPINLLDAATFNRVPGEIIVGLTADRRLLSDIIIDARHGAKSFHGS